jgi:zinc D-Ala-D-Ala carboxypeptidase
MPRDVQLTTHFYLSQFTASPHAGRAGMRNEARSEQIENLRRLAQTLEVVRANLVGADIHVLRAFRRIDCAQSMDAPAFHGRCAEFIAPAFGTPRDICGHLIAHGLVFDRLVNCGEWVQLEIPLLGAQPRRQLQTGTFEHGHPMRYLEGLI